jgi:hypothetical protein
MKTSTTDDAMTVDELIEALRGYDRETPVYLAVRMGPTVGLEPIVDLSLQKSKYSDQRSMLTVVAAGTPVIALETP